MSDDWLRVEIADRVAVLTLNRPEKLNAISVAMDRAFNQLVFDLNADDEVRVVVLTGAGDRAFCVGSDLSDLEGYGTSWQYRNRVDRHLDYALGLLQLRKPVIAAIHGYCIGGGLELACGSDIRLATRSASFAAGEIKWGWHGGSGATQLLTRIVGPGHASELLLTGDRIDAEEAQRIGLVNHLYEDQAALMLAARTLALVIAGHSPIAVESVKKLVRVAQSSSLDVGLAYENDLFSYQMRSEDAAEGRRAFAEKRPPHFTGQ